MTSAPPKRTAAIAPPPVPYLLTAKNMRKKAKKTSAARGIFHREPGVTACPKAKRPVPPGRLGNRGPLSYPFQASARRKEKTGPGRQRINQQIQEEDLAQALPEMEEDRPPVPGSGKPEQEKDRGWQEENKEVGPRPLPPPGAIDAKQNREIEKNPPRELLLRQAGIGIKRKEGKEKKNKPPAQAVF